MTQKWINLKNLNKMNITPEQEEIIARVKSFVKETTEQQEALYQELTGKLGIEKPDEDHLFDFIFNPDFVESFEKDITFAKYLEARK